ncbi:MAG: hypothetical protein J7619_11980 [Dyadobacter sp.]|uniref:hypothetical protein n=1 Tax=Dyadobacter sp. TaxID=1914288 RepID=UPI001B1B92B8|nr:hypothetical protein [Dyadobacter sp.]MBO9613411.1 hypothetical protein [Dyadobacter sp.]
MKTNLKGIVKALSLILWILPAVSVTSWAQESNQPPKRTAFESALLDSAYRYEKLKPTFFSLKSAYESQTKEVTELRTAMRLQNLQNEMQKQNIEASRSQERNTGKRNWWRGFRFGIGLGVTGGILLGLKL